MKKKLITALFAAAFLATGGIIKAEDQIIDGPRNESIILNVENWTITENGSLVGNAGNDIVFTDGETLTNKGVIDLTGVSGTTPTAQTIEFGDGGAIVNAGGAIKIGKDTVITDNDDDFKFAAINNFGDVDGEVVQGNIEINGGNAKFTTFIGLVEGKTDSDGRINIGNITITDKVDIDVHIVLSSATYGSVTITDKQDMSGRIDVGTAKLELAYDGFEDENGERNGNTIHGNILGGEITFSGDYGSYFGSSIWATGGDINFVGSDNLFDNANGSTVLADGGDVNISGSDNNFYSVVIAKEGPDGKGGDIEITGDGNFFFNGFQTSDDHYTTLASGRLATINGVIDTNYVAKDNSITSIDGGDVLISDGMGMFFGENAIIQFGEHDDEDRLAVLFGGDDSGGRGAYLTVDPTTRLLVEVETAREYEGGTSFQLMDDVAAQLLAANFATPDAFADYLSAQNLTGIADTGVYSVGEDDYIRYTHNTEDDPYANKDAILNRQGIGWAAGMISDKTLQSQFDYATDYMQGSEDWEELPDRDKYLASVFNLASGYTVFDLDNAAYNLMDGAHANEAYAIEQWKNGADWAGALEAVADTARNFQRAMTTSAYDMRHLMGAAEYDECGNLIASCAGYKNRIWAGYTGQWDKNSGRNWNKGYKYDANGFNLGYDHITSSGVGFGAAFGYSKGDFDNYGRLFGDKSKIDNYSFGLYASFNHASGFFTMLSTSYTYSKYKMKTGFSTYASAFDDDGQVFRGYDRASYHGDTWSFGGKVGYDIQPTANLTITPTLGLYHYSGRTNRFNTDYRNGMKYSRNTLEMPLDVQVKYDVAVGCDSTLSLLANAGYSYNFHNKGTKINGFAMGSNPTESEFGDHRFVKQGRSAWNVGAGIQYRYRKLDFGVNYEYYGRSDFKSHNLKASVGLSF